MRDWRRPEWLSGAEPWLVDLVDGATMVGASLEFVDISSRHGEFRLQRQSTRFTDPRLVDPTLQIPAARFGTNPSGFFDAGEWLAVLGGDHSRVRGQEQLIVFERKDEIESLQHEGALGRLRQARDAWVAGEGIRAMHDDCPQWPDGVARPGWMVDLDATLLACGFEFGWIVEAGPEEPIGLVRQRGPLRVQLTVLDGVPLVQFAVWPHSSWMPFPLVARWIGLLEDDPGRLGPLAVVEIGAKFCDMVFDVHRTPNWSHISRIQYEKRRQPLGLGTGPACGGSFFRLTDDIPSIDEWIVPDSPDDPFRHFESDPERVSGGPFVTLKLKSGRRMSRLPPILNRWGGSYVVNAELRTAVEQHAPDAHFFEFRVEGVPLYEVRLPTSSRSSVSDLVRSLPGLVGGTALWAKAVDPRQMGRPGHIVVDDEWFFDDRVKDALTPFVGEACIRSTWDHEGALRLKASGYPTPEQMPHEYR